MSRTGKTVCIFFVIQIVSAFAGWCSGYNFDYRSAGVAVWVMFSIVVGCSLANPFMWED
mgnify:CR=1 FL=1